MFGATKINENEKTHLRRNTIPFKIFCVTTMCVSLCVCAHKIFIVVMHIVLIILVNGIRRNGILLILLKHNTNCLNVHLLH